MRILVFLSRVALLCNLFFVLCVLIRFKDLLPGNDSKGLVIIMGWVLAPFMNLVVNVWAGVLLAGKKSNPVPKWLLVVNFIFLLLQIIFLPLK